MADAGYYVNPLDYQKVQRDRALALLKYKQSAATTDYNLGLAMQSRNQAQRDLGIRSERQLESFSTPFQEAGLANSGIQNLAFTRRAQDISNAQSDILTAYAQAREGLLLKLQQERDGIALDAGLSAGDLAGQSAGNYADLIKGMG